MLADQMSQMRSSKPRSLAQTFGSRGPTPEQRDAYNARVKEWNRNYRKLAKQQKQALADDNAAFNARRRR